MGRSLQAVDNLTVLRTASPKVMAKFAISSAIGGFNIGRSPRTALLVSRVSIFHTITSSLTILLTYDSC